MLKTSLQKFVAYLADEPITITTKTNEHPETTTLRNYYKKHGFYKAFEDITNIVYQPHAGTCIDGAKQENLLSVCAFVDSVYDAPYDVIFDDTEKSLQKQIFSDDFNTKLTDRFKTALESECLKTDLQTYPKLFALLFPTLTAAVAFCVVTASLFVVAAFGISALPAITAALPFLGFLAALSPFFGILAFAGIIAAAALVMYALVTTIIHIITFIPPMTLPEVPTPAAHPTPPEEPQHHRDLLPAAKPPQSVPSQPRKDLHHATPN